jgi:hypothetical protein
MWRPPLLRAVLEAANTVGEEFAVAAVVSGAQHPVDDVHARCEGLAGQDCFLEDTGVASWIVWPIVGRRIVSRACCFPLRAGFEATYA